MPKRYIFNDSDATIFVGGIMILPQQGREVDEAYLPPEDQADPELLPEDPGIDPDANLLDLLKASVKDLKEQLSTFSDETLAGLLRLENAAETPRATLIAAITAEQLDRAGKTAGGAE